MTAPRILSPEEYYAAKQQQDEPKPKVTVGPLQPVGIPADEMARVASGEMGLGNSIAARLALAHAPDADANAVLEDVNRRTAPGLASTAANVFLSNTVAPFSEKMAEAGAEGALERFTTGGGDPGAHANLLGLAAAGGAVTGNAALAKATPPVNVEGASALKAVGIRAAEGAGQNAAVSLAGSVMDEDSLPDAAKKALLNAGAGAVFGAGIEGVGRVGEIRAGLSPDPKPPVAEQVRSEILGRLDPRDRHFAMTDPAFGRAFNPEGRPHVMSPEEFAQARAARDAEQAQDVQALRQGGEERQGVELRFPVERTSAAKNAEPMLNLKNRAGKVDLSSAPAKLPPLRDNYLGDLGRFGRRVYRETNADGFFGLMMGHEGPQGAFFGTSENLALGQGNNRGVVLELDPKGLQGIVNTAKPGWEVAYQNGEAELIGRHNKGDDYFSRVRAVTIKPEVMGNKGYVNRLRLWASRATESGEWERVANADGSLTLRRLSSAQTNRVGSTAPEVQQALASAGVGAAVGASQDKEDRLRGAMLGGATGLAAFAGAKRGGKLGLSTDDVSGDANPMFRRTEPAGTPYTAPIDNGADPRLFNLKKYGFSPEGETIFRDIVGTLELKKKRVSHDATFSEAERRSLDPDNLIRLKGQWDGADALGARLFTAASTERIALLSRNIRKGALTPEEAEAARAEIARLTDDIGIMAGRSAKERSAAGRNLNAYKIVARNTMDVATWQELAQRAKGLPLTTDELLTLRQQVTDLNREGLVRFVAGLHRSTPVEKAMTLWKAGLLTAPVTHVVNNVGNASMQAMETAKEPIAAMADRVISLVRGTERTKAPSLRGLALDPIMAGGRSLKAATAAVRRAGVLGALRENMTAEMMGKWDFRQVNFDSPVLQAYTDVVFGSLSAEDRIWRNMAFARSMEEQVRLAAPKVAKAEGITVQQATANLRQQPPEELTLKAVGDAELAVFQNKNALSEGMRRFRSGVRDMAGPKGEAVVDFVAPFVRTPTNVALRLADYSPLGAIKLWKVLKPELTGAEQKAAAEQVGRVALGSGLVWLGFSLAAQGKATGAYPRDAAAKGQNDLEGKQANSVKIGGSWVNVSRISPAGMLVAVGAQMYDVAREAKSPMGAVAGAAFTPARVALDQSFLKGVSGTLDAANDPARYGERFAEQTAGSLVPAGIAAIARATDKTVRTPEGVGQTIAARIPGLSRTVPARRDPFGQPVERVAGAVEQFLSPAPRTKDKTDDPVVRELARLGLEISAPSRMTTQGKGRQRTRTKLGQDDYAELQSDAGPRMRDALALVMNRPEYQQMADEQRALVLERVVSRAKAQAYALQRKRRTGVEVAGEESAP